MRPYDVLTHPERLSALPGRKFLVGGHSVFSTLRADVHSPNGFVQQADRNPVGGLKGLLAHGAARLRVFVHPALTEHPKTRFALTTDAYLRWGQRSGVGTTVLLGGVEDASGTYLEVLIFNHRVLVDLVERQLPPRDAAEFATALSTLIAELNAGHPQARLVAAAPLSDLERPDVTYLGAQALSGLRFAPLSRSAALARPWHKAASVLGIALLIYVAALSAGWTVYQSALNRYATAAADPALAAAGGIDMQHLDVLQQRRLLMEAPRRQEVLTGRGTALIAGIGAVPGVRIIELRLPAPSLTVSPAYGGVVTPAQVQDGAVRPPDLSMTISVPLAPVPAMDQATAVLTAISRRTAMDLRLTHNGWRDDEASGTRILVIEGFLQ